ncbi:hypothetical protein GCM10028801_19550 [Nocardioides maradonensis]
MGYPLWWLLGVTLPMTVLAVALLAAELMRLPRLRFPRFGGLWILFLVWVLVGVLVVQVDAPLAVGGWNTNRYITWALRLFWYVAATILLLYLGNVADRTARVRLFGAFGWMFVWIVAGGLLGWSLPHAQFPSALQLVLPSSLSSNAFVMSLVHPNLAESMEFAGVTRPSAPFPFANVWGLNFACFLPFFVVGWGQAAERWKRRAVPVVLAIAVVPVVESLNRGLWLALGVAVVVLAARALSVGNTRVVLGLALGLGLVVVVVLLSPLRTTIADRFSSPNSNDSRSELASREFASTLSSPLVGFGTTRDVQGSLTSIAGGSTPECPRCGAPSFGTQGQIFLTTFAQGYGGAAFYLVFLLLLAVRAARRRGGMVTMALCVLGMHAATLSVYSADNLAVLAIFAAAGVLWRAADERWQGVPLMVQVVGRRPCMVAALTACGGVLGLVAFEMFPRPVSVTTPVQVAPAAAESVGSPATLDTVAQLVHHRSVVGAVARAVHAAPRTVSQHIDVTADPNTRVLFLTYAADDPKTATAGSLACARALLSVWGQWLRAGQRWEQHGLTTRLGGIGDAIAVVSTGRRALRGRTWGPVGRSATRQLAALGNGLLLEWSAADDELRTSRSTDVEPGRLIGPPQVDHPPTPWARAVAEGVALAFLVAPLIVGRRGGRVSVLRRTEPLS